MDEKKVQELIKKSSSLKLLYVEDNEDVRETTLTTLQVIFTNITIAVDGQDAYEKYKNNTFDLIITDINMPKLSGVQLIEKIHEEDKEINILVLSAHEQSSSFIDKLGIQGSVLKPIELSQFIDVIYKTVVNIQNKVG